MIVVIGAAATLFGWDVVGWLEEVWNTITTISIGYLLAGIVLITIADDGGRVRVVLDPALRLSGPGALGAGLRLLRDGGRAQLRAARRTSARS